MPALQPFIKLTFRGMLLLFLSEGGEFCDVRFLANPPDGHKLQIDVTESNDTGAPQIITQLVQPDLKDRLELTVDNPSRPGVHLFRPGEFDREKDIGDPNDFRWMVDYSELYRGVVDKIEFNPALLTPVLRINNGTFFTETKSVNQLHMKSGPGGQTRAIGKVATAMGAYIYMDIPGSTFTFTNGDETVLMRGLLPGVTYGINVSQSRQGPLDAMIVDANSYNSAVGLNVPADKKISFVLPPGGHGHEEHATTVPISGHAECFTGGQTGPTGP